jgi:hypothetical protein
MISSPARKRDLAVTMIADGLHREGKRYVVNAKEIGIQSDIRGKEPS